MDAPGRKTLLTALYFTVAALLATVEAFRRTDLLIFGKPLLLPILATLYLVSSKKPSTLYLAALFLGVISNTLFIFPEPILFYGVTTFLVYRIFIIILVVRYTPKFHLLAFAIAIIPFLFAFAYVIDLTLVELSDGLYPAIANAIVMSVLAALALSNYVFDDDHRNTWLIISAMLSVVLLLLFVIERFYLENPVFKPMAAIIFTAAHYTFYRYLILSESESQTVTEPKNKD